MKFGLRPFEGGTDFSRTIEQAVRAEELGFDSVWFAEHYTDDGQWWPASLLNLAAIASRTSEIVLGTNVLITPYYRPVWLASATAMLDVISDGRVICGLGVGYNEPEFAAMQVPREERVGRFIETVMLLKRLWTERSVSFDGAHFTLDSYGISPKPVQDPHPPVWFGVWGSYLLGQAAKRADAWIPGAVADLATLLEKQETYDGFLESEPANRPLLRDIVVGESMGGALRTAERHLHPKYETYRRYGHDQFEAYSVSAFESFCQNRAIVGTPSSCIDQIETYKSEFGVDHLILRFSYPGMSVLDVNNTMDVIASEVMPSFN